MTEGNKAMAEWRYWPPKHDGDAPPDWVEGMDCEVQWPGVHSWLPAFKKPKWAAAYTYRYRPAETYEQALESVKLEYPLTEVLRSRAERAERECEELRKRLKIEQTAADDYKREAEILERMIERANARIAKLQGVV